MEALIDTTLDSIANPAPEDPIRECFTDDEKLKQLVLSDTDEALELSDKKLRVFPFKDVKESWRRLYTDASIAKACYTIRDGIGRPCERRRSTNEGQEHGNGDDGDYMGGKIDARA